MVVAEEKLAEEVVVADEAVADEAVAVVVVIVAAEMARKLPSLPSIDFSSQGELFSKKNGEAFQTYGRTDGLIKMRGCIEK